MAEQRIAAPAAAHHICACAGDQQVGAFIADNQIGEFVTDAEDAACTGDQCQIFDLGKEIMTHRCLDTVSALIDQFEDDVACGIDDEQIVTAAAVKLVVPRAAVDQVVAARALDAVIALQPAQHIGA